VNKFPKPHKKLQIVCQSSFPPCRAGAVALVSKRWHAVETTSSVQPAQITIDVPQSSDLWRLDPTLQWHTDRHSHPVLHLHLHSRAVHAFFPWKGQRTGLHSLTLSGFKHETVNHFPSNSSLASKWRFLGLLPNLKVISATPPMGPCSHREYRTNQDCWRRKANIRMGNNW